MHPMSHFEGLPMLIDHSALKREMAAYEPRLSALGRGDPMPTASRPAAPRGEQVAVLELRGVILHSASPLAQLFGWSGIDNFSRMFDEVMAMQQVRTVVIRVDSPGGSVFGVQELASKIFKARSKRQIIAVADPLACSAAYWIASAASKLICTPSGEVGSIGVYAVQEDISRAAEMAGVKHTIVKAGARKAEGLPIAPLGDDAKSHMQSKADDIHGEFLDAVAKHRGTTTDKVRKTYGEGRSMRSKEALRVGLIDRIATFDQVLAELTRPAEPAKSSAQSLRAKYGDLLN
jgi:signal peptide peptidase SppA